jgi:WD40 repeat protein
MRILRWPLFVVAILASGWLWPDLLPAQPTLPGVPQTPFPDAKNTPRIVKLFREVVAGPNKSTVRVRCNGKDTALGTIVAEDGSILTKASDLYGRITCTLPDGQVLVASIQGINEPYDLALLKVEASGLLPVTWADSKVATLGRWVASASPEVDPVAIGVISVATRKLVPGDQPPKTLNPNSGYLGINLEDAPGGARILSANKGTPAEKAGLKIGDVVTHVGTRRILDTETLINHVSRLKPGDQVTLKVERGLESLEFKATLAARPKELLGNPQELMGSTLSTRRGGFPVILEHDTVLKPSDCGGPLVDLDGEVLGINISRSGRVATYAIPAEIVRDLLPDLRSGKLMPSPSALREMLNPNAPKVAALLWGASREDVGEVRSLPGHTGAVLGVALSPDGRHALTGSADKTLRLWDLETGKTVRTFEGHTAGVWGVAIAPDGRTAVSGSSDGTVRAWDLTTGKETGQIAGDSRGKARGLAYARDGRQIAVAGERGVMLWDGEAKLPSLLRLAQDSQVHALAISPDNRFVLTGHGSATGNNGLVRLWDVRTTKELSGFEGHRGTVNALAFSPDGRKFLSGSHDGTVRLWERDTGNEIHVFKGHTGGVEGVAFAPDSTRVLSCGTDGTVRLWDVATGQEIHNFTAHAGGASCVTFSPDGSLAISGGADNVLRIWRLPR